MKKLLVPIIIVALMLTSFIISADEEVVTDPVLVISVNSNDITLADGIVINTTPKSYLNAENLDWGPAGWLFVDTNENGDNDLLEALIDLPIVVVGEPVYEEVPNTDPVEFVLVAIDAYTINGRLIREPGKAPWAKGPK
jgi:hypothetical protein